MCSFFVVLGDHSVSQVLWPEAHQNDPFAAARRRALGVSLLVAAGYLDAYKNTAGGGRQRTTSTLCASGRVRRTDTHRLLARRERRALAREWCFERQRPRK